MVGLKRRVYPFQCTILPKEALTCCWWWNNSVHRSHKWKPSLWWGAKASLVARKRQDATVPWEQQFIRGGRYILKGVGGSMSSVIAGNIHHIFCVPWEYKHHWKGQSQCYIYYLCCIYFLWYIFFGICFVVYFCGIFFVSLFLS